jgi:hypothetical protein
MIGVFPRTVVDAVNAWYRAEATHEQLALGAREIPRILASEDGQELNDSQYTHYLLTASGMRAELARQEAAERLRSEGIE